MPEASEQLRSLMAKRFGDPVNDYGPMKFLSEKGWTDKGGMFRNSKYGHLNDIPRNEWECIAFMCDEWDYGIDGSFNK